MALLKCHIQQYTLVVPLLCCCRGDGGGGGGRGQLPQPGDQGCQPCALVQCTRTRSTKPTFESHKLFARSHSPGPYLSLCVCVCFWGERAVCGWASAGARLLVCKWGVGSCGARASTFDVLFWLVFAAGVVCLCCPHMRPRRRRSWSLSVIVACACVLSICIDFMIIRISCAVWSALSPSRPTIVCVCVLCSTTCVFGVLAVYVCVMLC